jgi:hypothetical protein
MLEWILTSGAIAAFAAASLELFRESGPEITSLAPASWQTMTDADLDALMVEFSDGGNEDKGPAVRLAA